jgi:hypothetical protein
MTNKEIIVNQLTAGKDTVQVPPIRFVTSVAPEYTAKFTIINRLAV